MQLTRSKGPLLVAGIALCVGLGAFVWHQVRASRSLIRWFLEPAARSELVTLADLQPCPDAPFILPTSGFVGLLWGDTRLPYSTLRQHSGLDILGDGEVGQVPVYAAFDGYLTRLPGWRSAVIIRHPQDPLAPSRQIWTYYAHMADEGGNSFIAVAFPPGSSEIAVKQGTFLGYQGVYNGGRGRTGLHLHFSVVRDESGRFLDETMIENSIDPSPYLGMQVSYSCAKGAPHCVASTGCPEGAISETLLKKEGSVRWGGT